MSDNRTSVEEEKRAALARVPWRRVGECVGAGVVIGLACALLGVYGLFRRDDLFLATALVGGLLGMTRLHRLWLGLAVLAVLTLAIVAYTPLSSFLLSRWNRSDPLPAGLIAPAVVVLSSHVQKGQTLDARAQERMVRGYELVGEGRAQRLVVTEAALVYGSQAPVVRAQMRALRLTFPVDTVGPVRDTHDEALAVARLARARGWQRVLLVTHPWHMRRSAAVFQKAGVSVLCVGCVEGSYDQDALNETGGRLAAFRDWLHEVIGYQIYRWRGWID